MPRVFSKATSSAVRVTDVRGLRNGNPVTAGVTFFRPPSVCNGLGVERFTLDCPNEEETKTVAKYKALKRTKHLHLKLFSLLPAWAEYY